MSVAALFVNFQWSKAKCFLGAAFLLAAHAVLAQADLPLYTDNLVNGFQNWSWATVDLADTSYAHDSSDSIAVTCSGGYQALYLEHPDFDTSPYASLSFWINGGAGGGQTLQVYGLLSSGSQTGYPIGPLLANTWQHYTIPLSALGVANQPDFSGIWIQSTVSSALPTFYVDDIRLLAAPAPALVHLNVDAAQTIRTVDARWFGINTAVWDSDLDAYTPPYSTTNALQEMGCLSLRFPGGSLSDTYHWATGKSGNTTWYTKFSNFMHVATNLHAQVFITVNYGTGTSNEAAAWVRSANITNHCGFKYWEIGNECYGTWETDANNLPHDPYTYAVRAAGYIQLMKAADTNIEVGVVAVPGEGSYSNNATHFVINPRTGTTNYGWTPIMLTTLKDLGVTPDFLVEHFYPEYTPASTPPPANDSDPLVLQVSRTWALDAADLRQQINDYFGPGGSNIELVCTENNSDAGALGRQLTSLVNGLYLADSLSQLMKTEFNAYTWWDLRNGTNNNGSFDPTLYGWRTYGDEGVIYGSGSSMIKYPTFYAMKLLKYFVRPGDTVLNADSDYLLLSAYAARRANGALTLLVLNKDALTNFNAQISLANFDPSPTAAVRSYGIPQDEAARTNAPAASQDIAVSSYPSASPSFTYSFPPYSLTLFTFAPAPPQLLPLSDSAGEFVVQLQGQPGTPYVMESCADLTAQNWVAVSTNTLTGSVLTITNAVAPGSPQQFWRAVWRP